MSARSLRSRSCQAEEFSTCARVVADEAMQRRSNGCGARLLHPAKRHAYVLGLQHHTDPVRLQLRVKAGCDLGRKALLQLEIACEQLDDTGQLGEAEDTLSREVGDVSDAIKRQHV